jgi:TolB protein
MKEIKRTYFYVGLTILVLVILGIVSKSSIYNLFSSPEGQRNLFCFGNKAVRLTENNTYDENPKWSPDSNWLAYIGDDNGEQIYLIDPNTKQTIQITDNQGYYYDYGDISWSPDGEKILLPVTYFSVSIDPSPFNSVIIDVPDSINEPFTQPEFDSLQSFIPGYPIGWSPDGNGILVMDNQEPDNFDTSAIFIYQMDNSSLFQISPSNLRVWEASWSPNGEQIAYSASIGDSDTEIYLINADGTDNIQLTDNDANEIVPIWSADGKYIAFTTNRNGNWDIYAFSMTAKNTVQITDNPLQELITSWNSENIIAFTANWDSSDPQDIILNENVFLSLSDYEIYIMKVYLND